PIRMQRDRYLRDFFSIEAGLDDHFGGEFHPCASLIEAVLEVPGEAAQAAVNVMDRRLEPPARQAREHRIAQPAVEKRHCAGQDRAATACETATLDQCVTFAQLGDDARDFAEIVGI